MTKIMNNEHGQNVSANEEGTLRESAVSVRAAELAKLEEEWSQAGIGNAFLFGKIMTARPDLLLELLQQALPEMHIRSIHSLGRETDIKLSIDARGIRLDVSAKDDQGRSIDVEMQLKDEKNIPRRMRYYAGAIDQTLLEKGGHYDSLSETVILFITMFDPFQKGLIRYSFRNVCLEDKDLELGDGTTKVVLNACGTRGDASEDLKGFLRLVAGAETHPDGSFADRVQQQVRLARKNSVWRREFMDWHMTLLGERIKGREEGKKEGIEEGTILERIEIITRKVKKGVGLSAVAEWMEVPEEELRPIWEAVKQAAPEYDEEKILQALRDGEKSDR